VQPRGQVPSALRGDQNEAHPRQDAHLRQRCHALLPTETIPGPLRHWGGTAQRRAAEGLKGAYHQAVYEFVLLLLLLLLLLLVLLLLLLLLLFFLLVLLVLLLLLLFLFL
jgi:hypothetical protein